MQNRASTAHDDLVLLCMCLHVWCARFLLTGLSRFVHYEFLAPVVTIWIYNIQTVGNNSPNFYYFVAFLAAPVLFFFSITGISIGNFIFS